MKEALPSVVTKSFVVVLHTRGRRVRIKKVKEIDSFGRIKRQDVGSS